MSLLVKTLNTVVTHGFVKFLYEHVAINDFSWDCFSDENKLAELFLCCFLSPKVSESLCLSFFSIFHTYGASLIFFIFHFRVTWNVVYLFSRNVLAVFSHGLIQTFCRCFPRGGCSKSYRKCPKQLTWIFAFLHIIITGERISESSSVTPLIHQT